MEVYDLDDIVVTVRWQSRVGDFEETEFTFAHDPLPKADAEGSWLRCWRGTISRHERMPAPLKGSARYAGFARGSAADGCLVLPDASIVPWHRVFVMRVKEIRPKQVEFRWRYERPGKEA